MAAEKTYTQLKTHKSKGFRTSPVFFYLAVILAALLIIQSSFLTWLWVSDRVDLQPHSDGINLIQEPQAVTNNGGTNGHVLEKRRVGQAVKADISNIDKEDPIVSGGNCRYICRNVCSGNARLRV